MMIGGTVTTTASTTPIGHGQELLGQTVGHPLEPHRNDPN
jgi:hypothetical protein